MTGLINTTQYVGIPYKDGVDDCYSLMQKFFKNEGKVTLRDYVRPAHWWETDGLDLLKDNFLREGFEKVEIPVTELRVGDGFLIANGGTKISHCGVYVGEGNFLHHPYGKLSLVEYYRGAYKRMTLITIRHKSAAFPQPTYAQQNLLDLLLPHKRAMVEDVIAQTSGGSRPTA